MTLIIPVTEITKLRLSLINLLKLIQVLSNRAQNLTRVTVTPKHTAFPIYSTALFSQY